MPQIRFRRQLSVSPTRIRSTGALLAIAVWFLALTAPALALAGANTNPATSVTSTGAALHAWPWCTSTTCNYYFRWGIESSGGYSGWSPGPDEVSSGFSGSVTADATALTPGTLYSYQICVGPGTSQAGDTCYGPNGQADTYSTFTTLAGLPPAPSGPATPDGGWHVAMADDFNAPLGTAAGRDALWYPNRFCGNATDGEGDNPKYDLQDYNPSQDSVSHGNLIETAKYDPGEHPPFGSGDPKINYVSGDVTSSTGCSGRGDKGFDWIPDEGETWAFEIDAQFPVNTGELFDSFWSTTEQGWYAERDFFEGRSTSTYELNTDWGYNTHPFVLDFYETIPGDGGSGDGLSFNPSAAMHRYTYVVYPNQSWSFYVDGRLQTWVGDNGVAPVETSREANPHQPMYLYVNYALADRNAAGTGWKFIDSKFTSGSRRFIINSVAAYEDGDHAGRDIVGGGLAPGTRIASH